MGNRNKPQKRKKLEIVFDSKKRVEFLTGFRKRKNLRKKKAKEELEHLLKEEKKRIRLEVKDGLKNMKKSFEPLPDVEELLREDRYENDAVTIKVVELSANDLASRQNWLGENRPRYSDNDESSSEDGEKSDQDEVPGMGLVEKKVAPTPVVEKKRKKPAADEVTIKTKKDLNRLTYKKTLRSMKNNKLFQMKSKLDRLANKKKARKERMQQQKQSKKDAKRRPQGKFKKTKGREK